MSGYIHVNVPSNRITNIPTFGSVKKVVDKIYDIESRINNLCGDGNCGNIAADRDEDINELFENHNVLYSRDQYDDPPYGQLAFDDDKLYIYTGTGVWKYVVMKEVIALNTNGLDFTRYIAGHQKSGSNGKV